MVLTLPLYFVVGFPSHSLPQWLSYSHVLHLLPSQFHLGILFSELVYPEYTVP